MKNQSKYDPSRKTVGAIYRDAQFSGEKQIITGDMNYELRKSLVEDINDTVIQGTKDFEGKPFYITVHEKRDLQMKNAFIRRMLKTVYRPYPEDDTLVFRVIPYTASIYFCWELPHRSNMINMLSCPDLYDPEILHKFRQWENMQLENYGFMKNNEGNWVENPMYRGDKLVSNKDQDVKPISVSKTCKELMCEAS